jgi:hypothetical protein
MELSRVCSDRLLESAEMASQVEDNSSELAANGEESTKAKEEEAEEDLFADAEEGDKEQKQEGETPSDAADKPDETKKTNVALEESNEEKQPSHEEDTGKRKSPVTPESSPNKSLQLTSIPRKERPSIAPPPPPVKQQPPLPTATSSINPSVFGLPASVRIPASIDHSVLNGKNLELIKSLPPSCISDALQEFDEAVNVKGQGIRNLGAYLNGVIKRYITVIERARTGDTGVLPMGEGGLTARVEQRLEELVTSGFCTREEMNDKVRAKIRMLSERDAIMALDELQSTDRSSIRQFGSYFMGILNRYMRGEQQPKVPSRSEKDRGREYRSRSSSSSFNVRDRSRDRFDQGRAPPPRRGGEEGGLPQYDTRQQQPWNPSARGPQQQQPPPYSSSLPPPPPQMQQSMYGQPQQQSFMPQGFQQQPGMYQQPPPQYQQQQPQPNVGPPSGQPYRNQPFSNQPYAGSQPPPVYGSQQSYPGSQQPFMQQQQQPPLQYSQPPMMNQQQPYMGEMPGQQQQQYQPPPSGKTASFAPAPGGWQQSQPLDIMGLADKAANAVQALAANQNNYVYPSQQPPQMANQLPPYGQAPPMGQMPPQQSSYGGKPQQQSFRRSTTATIDQLPLMVQYAVQNIQNTGAVDEALDPGLLGMIHDLPEPMALAALNKFASLDKSTMRNKNAYLAGLLRRELETIKRR